MVVPAYVVGIGVPLVFGLLAVGLFLLQQSGNQHEKSHHHQNRSQPGPGYDTRHEFSYSNCSNCSICLEELKEPIQRLPCNHKLHRACYQKLIKEHKRCPECRKNFAA